MKMHGAAVAQLVEALKVAGSIPDGVIGIFHWHNPVCRTMALGSTQPLTEISTRNIYWGVNVAGAYGWQPYHLHVPTVWKSGSLNLLEPSGPVQACNGIAFFIMRMQQYLWSIILTSCPSQCPHGLRRRSAAAGLLGLRFRIPPEAWRAVSCECCALSDRGLCVGLITRPEESCRVWCVWLWSWSLDNVEALGHWGLCSQWWWGDL
jgi:hypothetical protein